MIEGSGSMPLTNGSGSIKNIRIRKIRIRISNTGSKFLLIHFWGCFVQSKLFISALTHVHVQMHIAHPPQNPPPPSSFNQLMHTQGTISVSDGWLLPWSLPPIQKVHFSLAVAFLVLPFFCICCVAFSLIQRETQVLSFLSSRWNWESPTPSPPGECAPPPRSGGRGTLACGRGGGGERSQFRRGDIHCGTLCIYEVV